MTKFTVKVTPRLRRNLKRIDAATAGKILLEAAEAGAELIRKDASDRAPRDTGRLSKEIIIEKEKASKREATVKIGPSKDAFYGLYVEVGINQARVSKGKVMRFEVDGSEVFARKVSGMQAQPFLKPAFESKRDAAKRKAVETAWEAIERSVT